MNEGDAKLRSVIASFILNLDARVQQLRGEAENQEGIAALATLTEAAAVADVCKILGDAFVKEFGKETA